MAGYRRRKPLVSYEYGTRIYAPSDAEARYRVVATDADGQRVFAKFSSEDAARQRAREIESRLASSVLLPGRANAPTKVGGLIDRYLVSLSSRSTRYAERQEYLLRMYPPRPRQRRVHPLPLRRRARRPQRHRDRSH